MPQVENKQASHIRGDNYNLWIEIPPYCPLRCVYCFAETNEERPGSEKKKIPIPDKEWLTLVDYETVIRDFAEIVIQRQEKSFEIALPALGEPFGTANEQLVFGILKIAHEIENDLNFESVRTIIFTAADLKTEEAEEIASRIVREGYRTLVLVKCNCNWTFGDLKANGSLSPVQGITDTRKEIKLYEGAGEHSVFRQDILAGVDKDVAAGNRKSYTERRNAAMEVFVRRFLEDRMAANRSLDDRHQVGIVTSLVEDNAKIIEKNNKESGGQKGRPWLAEYLRVARELGQRYDGNFVFDCDTLLHHGRGARSEQDPPPDAKRECLRLLQREDHERGNPWLVTPTYVGGECHRFDRHMYVELDGTVRPCVGARRIRVEDSNKQSGVIFETLKKTKDGRVQSGALREIWEDSNNPVKEAIRKHKYYGACSTCLNFLLGECYSCLGRATYDFRTKSVRDLGYVKTKGCWNHRDDPIELLDRCCELLRTANTLAGETTTEPFWYQNVADGEIEKLWSGSGCFPKDISLLDFIELPLPTDREQGGVIDKEDLLAHVTYHAVKRLFVKEELWHPPEVWQTHYDRHEAEGREDTRIRWMTIFVYDDVAERYFVRTISHPDIQGKDLYSIRLLIRYFDFPTQLGGYSYQERIYDVSDQCRDVQRMTPGTLWEYCLALAPVDQQKFAGKAKEQIYHRLRDRIEVGQALPKRILDVSEIFRHPLIMKRSGDLRCLVEAFCSKAENQRTIDLLSKGELSQLPPHFVKFYTELPLVSDKDMQPWYSSSTWPTLLAEFENLARELNLGSFTVPSKAPLVPKVINYFIWLHALDPKIKSYEVFMTSPRSEKGNSLFGIVAATDNKLSRSSVYYVRNMLTYLLNPLEDQVDIELERRLGKTHSSLLLLHERRGKHDERSDIASYLREYANSLEPETSGGSLSEAYSNCFETSAIKILTHNALYAIVDQGTEREPLDDDNLIALALSQLDCLETILMDTLRERKYEWFLSTQLADINRCRAVLHDYDETLTMKDFQKRRGIANSKEERLYKQLVRLRSEYFQRTPIPGENWWMSKIDANGQVDDFKTFFPVEAVVADEMRAVKDALGKKTATEAVGVCPCQATRWLGPKRKWSEASASLLTVGQERMLRLGDADVWDFFQERCVSFLSLKFGSMFVLGLGRGKDDYVYDVGRAQTIKDTDGKQAFPEIREALEKRKRSLKDKNIGTAVVWFFPVKLSVKLSIRESESDINS